MAAQQSQAGDKVGGHAPGQPASAPDVMPPHELPPPAPDESPEGNNATIHHPDPGADRHRVNLEHRREIGPYVTGNT
jgi:hypothetical protein